MIKKAIAFSMHLRSCHCEKSQPPNIDVPIPVVESCMLERVKVAASSVVSFPNFKESTIIKIAKHKMA